MNTAFGASAANYLWWVSCWSGWRRFEAASRNLAGRQERLLLSLLHKNRASRYGRSHAFGRIGSINQFRRQVPIIDYDEIAAEIADIRSGAAGVLTTEPVTLLEPTSGSASAVKLIPYTRTLQRQFRRGLAPWIFDLFRHYPRLLGGPAFWSVSPAIAPPEADPGLPVGFEKDSDYLGRIGSSLAGRFMAVPDRVKELPDLDIFRYATLFYLLRAEQLRLISVWNPTFLTLLLDRLPDWWEQLLADIAQGRITPPAGCAKTLPAALKSNLRPDRKRAEMLGRQIPDDYTALWPHLELISCWTDGPSASYARHLDQDRFPGIRLQGKGFIATEAFVSLPLVWMDGTVFAPESHFCEFLPVSGGGEPDMERPLLAHQLQRGGVYSVVVTTGGGLYRYHLNDRIEIVGQYRQLPTLRFIGKGEQVADMFGEKLHDQFVSAIWNALCRRHRLAPRFAIMAPEERPGGTGYTVYLEPGSERPSRRFLDSLAAEVDQALRDNVHYDYCRNLGQLGPLQISTIGEGGSECYLEARRREGQRLGDIKPRFLQQTTGWRDHFRTAETGVAPS